MTTVGLRNDGRAIVVMARSPFVDIGAIKSRLAAVVRREADRQALYVAFLRDTIAKCRTALSRKQPSPSRRLINSIAPIR